ncbi:MAG: InlB B-repeat-containing protein [Eubacteriales bacterium]|nr:InlB B-repeat-containing protein [Eubacteriales bacterium]
MKITKKRKGSAALAVLLAVIMTIQTGIPVSAADDSVLLFTEGDSAESAVSLGAQEGSAGFSSEALTDVPEETPSESLAETPEKVPEEAPTETPAEDVDVFTEGNTAETPDNTPAESPDENSGEVPAEMSEISAGEELTDGTEETEIFSAEESAEETALLAAGSLTLDASEGNIGLDVDDNGNTTWYQTTGYTFPSPSYWHSYTGTVTITGTGNAQLSIHGGKHTVILDNVGLKPLGRQDTSGSARPAVAIYSGSTVNLEIRGDCTFKGSSSYYDPTGEYSSLEGLRIDDNSHLTISGSGTLQINGGDSLTKKSGVGSRGICITQKSSLNIGGDVEVNISGGNMTDEYKETTPGRGMYINNYSSFSFSGKKLSIEGRSGVNVLNNSSFTLSAGETKVTSRLTDEAAVDGSSGSALAVPQEGYSVRIKKGNATSWSTSSVSIATSEKERSLEVSFDQTKYSVTLQSDGNGASQGGSYLPGTEVSISAGTKEGYGFEHWESSGSGSFKNSRSADTVFIMPAENVTIQAVFAELRTLTVEGGTVNGQTSVKGIPGSQVTIELGKVAQGMAFLNWELTGGGSLSNAKTTSPVYTFGEVDGTVSAKTVEGEELRDFVVAGTDGSYNYNFNSSNGQGRLEITGSGTYFIYMRSGVNTTSDRIYVGDKASPTIVLNDINIDSTGKGNSPLSILSSGTVTLKLNGTNMLSYNGGSNGLGVTLQKNNSGTLIITSLEGDGKTSGELNVITTSYSAVAIGNHNNSCTNIKIRGGTINAKAPEKPAIGVGYVGGSDSLRDIEITGGKVTLTGGSTTNKAIGVWNASDKKDINLDNFISGITVADDALIKQGDGSASEPTDASAVVKGTKRYVEITFGDDIGSTVTGVSVTPNRLSIDAGETQQFSAEVSGGSNIVSRNVTWSVSGNTSKSTAIDGNGFLTVGADETATELTVTAASEVNSQKTGTASVTVIPLLITLEDYQMELSMESWIVDTDPKKPQAKVNGVDEKNLNITYSYLEKGGDQWTNEIPTKAGTYLVKARFKSDTYSGEKTAEFKIAEASLTLDSAVLVERTYDSELKSAEVKEVIFGGLANGETLQLGTDYSAEAVYEDADAGTNKPATVMVTLEDSEKTAKYLLGTGTTGILSATGTVNPKEVTNPTIQLNKESYECNGTPVEPTVVSVKDGDTVIPDTEYIVEYENNTEPGTGTVKIVNRNGGNYTVSGSVTFSITCEHSQYDENGFCEGCQSYYQPAAEKDGVYEISNAGQLYWFSALVRGDNTHAEFDNIIVPASGVYAVITNSITIPGSKSADWVPIGTKEKVFSGSFDGGQQKLEGLPGMLFGTVKNASLTNICIESGNFSENQQYAEHTGSIAGTIENSTLINSYSKAVFTGSAESSKDVGGLIGKACGTISNCYFAGTLNGTAGTTGGLVGSSWGDSQHLTMKNCYVYSDGISGTGPYIGAVIGWYHTNSSVSNCYYYVEGGESLKAAGAGDGGDPEQTERKDKTQFSGGETAWLLNSGKSDGTQAWYQKIDSDALPVLQKTSDNTVYKLSCTFYGPDSTSEEITVKTVYSNSNSEQETAFPENPETDYRWVWYTDAQYSGEAVEKAHVSVDGNKYYAKREPIAYKVTLHTNGGTISEGKNVTSYTYGQGVSLPTASDMSNDGYTFIGWYKDSSYKNGPVEEISSTDTGDKEYYAKWLSANSSVTEVSISGTAGVIDGTEITVVLPFGTDSLPTNGGSVLITPATGAKVTSGPDTNDNGATWTFTVTAQDGTTTKDYTLHVSIAEDPATENRADVEAAKAMIEEHDWTVSQTTASTEDTVKEWIKQQLAGMSLNGVDYIVEMNSLTAAEEGTAADRDGTNGTFAFTVNLSKGEDTGDIATSTYAEASVSVTTGVITATPYTKWTVTVNAGNGGTVSGGGTYEENSTVTLTVDPNNGYRFIEWREDGKTVSTEMKFSFKVTSDRTLTAVFKEETYQVTLYTNGGTISEGKDVSSYTYGQGVSLPTASDMSNPGYTFMGWYEDSSYKNGPVEEISNTDTGDKEYFAKWLSADASVTEVSVSGTAGVIGGAEITVVLPFGTDSLPTDSSAISVTPATGAKVTSGPNTDDEGATWTFTVTAQDGTTKDYTIHVSIAEDPAKKNRVDIEAAKALIEGRNWTVPQATANTEETVKEWIEQQLKEQLAGMNLNDVDYTVKMNSFMAASEGTAADRDGTNGAFTFTVKLSKGENTGNIATSTYAEASVSVTTGVITATPYTKWTVTVNAGYGGTASGGGTYEENSTVTLTVDPNNGYRFIEWREDGKTVSTETKFSFTVTSDRTLTAVFKEETYQVTLHTNGGTISEEKNVTSYTYGQGVSLPTENDLSNPGYTFIGWYEDSSYKNGPVEEISSIDTGDKEFFAKWLSADASVTEVSISGTAGTISGTEITVVLPFGTASLPTDSNTVSVTPADGANVTSGPDTNDGGKTWTFTVTAQDETTAKDYTIHAFIAEDPAMENRADVETAKTLIVGRDWTVPQTTANTEDTVKEWIKQQLAGMSLNGVDYIVEMNSLTAASEGTATDRDGTNGTFAFTVNLSKGEDTKDIATSTYAEANASVTTGVITATSYTKWTVTVNAGYGGTVSGGGTYEENSTVTLTAVPNSGYRFIGWKEGGKTVSTEAEISFTVTKDRTLTAVFEEIYYPPVITPSPTPLPPSGWLHRPDGGIQTPNGTVIQPGGTIILPDGTELKPDEDGNKPEISKDGTVTDINGTAIKPDGTIILPGEDKESDKDNTIVEQGEGTKAPIYDPETGNVTVQDGNQVTLPDGTKVTPPAGSTVQPDGSIRTPDGTTTKPDGTVIDPDGTTSKPDGTVIDPDGTTTKPDGTVIDPDGTIHNTDGSVQSADGTYLRPATPWLESAEVFATGNQVRAVLSGPAAGAEGYDYVISKNINCIRDKDYLAVSKNILLTKTDFRYIPKGTYYVYCHAWIRGADGKKVFGNWSNYKTVTVTATTPATPKITGVKVKGSTVSVTYTQCKAAAGYDVVLGKAARKVYGELRPVNYGTLVKKVKNGKTVTVTFKNVKAGTYYAGLHAWNRTSTDGKKVFSPWSNVRKIVVK